MSEKLKEYNKKRNFKKTVEPEGKIISNSKDSKMTKKSEKTEKSQLNLKYVIQHHLARKDHFDFRLEWKGVLLSWAVPKGPSYNPKDKRLAIQVEDHPIDYGTFEGTIPKGEYGGGTVMLWDEGVWEPLSDFDKGISDGSLKFFIHGKRLRGKWTLIKIKDKENRSKNNWLLVKEKDDYAKETSGIDEFKTSVKTGRTMSQIEKNIKTGKTKNPFDKVGVQLAKIGNVPKNGEWVYEIKYDGYRIVAFVEDYEIRLMTRNGKDFTKHFKDIEKSLVDWSAGRSMVLDGEIVIVDESGKTDFQLLQNHMRKSEKGNLAYVIFDILALDGKDLRNLPLIERKNILEKIMKKCPDNLLYSVHVKGDAKEIFKAACKMDLEGIIAKENNSKYNEDRNGNWIKLKCYNRQEFVIGGYILTEKKEAGISSLLLGYYKDDKLIFAGRTGTGMDEKTRLELESEFKKIKQKKCPFRLIPPFTKKEKVTYVKPVLVAEVQFAGWTGENQLRQASFKGLRQDKKPEDVVLEKGKTENILKNDEKSSKKDKKVQKNGKSLKEKKNKDGSINVGNVKITSPDKVVFDNPDIKKIDVIKYYEKVSKRMLPYLENRILSIVRCPQGANSQCFFKKHPDSINKGVVHFSVKNSEGKENNFFYVDGLDGLIYESQMNTLEFHIWGSTTKNLDKPDIMVFDLDPHESVSLGKVRQGAKDLKSILDQLSLTSFLKTSGGKGYHVVLPFKPSADWNKFSKFSKDIAILMEYNWPERYTSNVRKVNRKNKIYIDWVRNSKGATSVAPYSLRARKGATVSMPISWKELDKISPNGITMSKCLARLKKSDPWKDFFKVNQEIRE